MWIILGCCFASFLFGCVIGWQARHEDDGGFIDFDNTQNTNIDTSDSSFISLNTVVRTFQTPQTPTIADLVVVREVLTSEAQL